MADRDATWDVVVTVKAPESYVARFVEIYRQLGANRIHIFYDDPSQSHSIAAPDVAETICDATYWEGRRPRAVEKRQMANATAAARTSQADWIIHCDIDEHLYATGRVSRILAEVPDSCACVVVLPVEAVFSKRPEILEDVFSTPYFKSTRIGWKRGVEHWSKVYGDLARITLAGFWGHRVGKSFLRTSRVSDLHSMPIHMPSGPNLVGMNPTKARTMVLRHYDALLPEDWIKKHTDRISKTVLAVWAGERRDAQSVLVAEAYRDGGIAGALDVYDRMFVQGPDTLKAGIDAGAIQLIPPEARSAGD